MQIEHHRAHLTYCSNIHPGESWDETFQNLKTHTTQVRKGLTEEPFGIGLRLSHLASLELIKESKLSNFQEWLRKKNNYLWIEIQKTIRLLSTIKIFPLSKNLFLKKVKLPLEE